jgi:hypothetical protein
VAVSTLFALDVLAAGFIVVSISAFANLYEGKFSLLSKEARNSSSTYPEGKMIHIYERRLN